MSAALLMGVAACTSGAPPTNVTELTIPPATADPSTGPSRTLPPSGTGTQSTVGGKGRATVESFDLPPRLVCDLGATVSVTATYTTSSAREVAFLIDGTAVRGDPPMDGTFDVNIPCDGAVHTVVLTAIDHSGAATVSSKAILTNAEPIGD